MNPEKGHGRTDERTDKRTSFHRSKKKEEGYVAEVIFLNRKFGKFGKIFPK